MCRVLSPIGLLLFCLQIGSCGKTHSASLAGICPVSSSTDSLLETELLKQLKALGKDPEKTPSAAPQGSDNAVFDLHADLLDAGGNPLPPGQPGVTGVRLTWTEQLIGDYDQNGEVNVADVKPLGAHYQHGFQVDYDDPALHGGFAAWPTGDPDGAGAANWRLARIDGDGNRELFLADLQAIGKHFKESMGGYRVYRQAPGETSFTRLPDPLGVSGVMTLVKPPPPQPGQLIPVRYSFTDAQATSAGLGAGVYQFMVVPFDTSTGQEGPASGTIAIDIVAGTVNHFPVAKLKVTPDYAATPAPVELDASASYDYDGGIQTFSWDLDGDGTLDWVSGTALPADSSDGTVKDITANANGSKLTATYNQPAAQYLHPKVTVTDFQATNTSTTAQLGLHGWTHELISSDQPQFVPAPGHALGLSIEDLSLDPATGEAVAVGLGPGGLRLARRSSAGDWSEEVSVNNSEPLLTDVLGPGAILNPHLGWQANGQPLIMFIADYHDPAHEDCRLLLAERQPAGNWKVSTAFNGDRPPDALGYRGPTNCQLVQSASGRCGCLVNDYVDGKDVNGGPAVTADVVLYDHGAVTVDRTGWTTKDVDPRYLTGLAFDNAGNPSLLIEPTLSSVQPPGTWRLTRLSQDHWQPARIDDGTFLVFPVDQAIEADGTLAIWSYGKPTSGPAGLGILRGQAGALSAAGFVTLQPATVQLKSNPELYAWPQGYASFSVNEQDGTPASPTATLYYDLFRPDGSQLHEDAYVVHEVSEQLHAVPYMSGAIVSSNGTPYLSVYIAGGGEEYSIPQNGGYLTASVQLLCTRVDPRAMP